MVVTLVIMVAAAAVALALARYDQRRRRNAPTVARAEPPTSLDRRDFAGPEATWLIAVFSSASCASCAAVVAELRSHEGPELVVVDVEVGSEPGLHRKYGIDSVPTAVIADRSGNARLAFVGPLGPDHRQALHELIHGAERGL